jgi:hypothetical protein
VRDVLIGCSVSVQLPQHSGRCPIYEGRNGVLLAHKGRIKISILVIVSTQKPGSLRFFAGSDEILELKAAGG